MKFPKQIALAALIMTGSVAALVWVGRDKSDRAPAAQVAPASPPGGVAPTPPPTPKDGGPVSPPDPTSARHLVPPDAWLVVDFRGDLTGRLPFEDQGGLCAKVPPPDRVVFGILAPQEGGQPDLLLAAPRVDEQFWLCAVARIEAAGGGALAQNEEYQVFQSPSGLVARGPGGAMVFLTSQTHLESALAVLSGIAPSAADSGPHARLLSRMHPQPEERDQVIVDATLALPEDWLASVGQDADKSPLRHIRAAFLSAYQDGSAQGGVDCDEAGCAAVLAFLIRAQGDFVATLPAPVKLAVSKSLRAEHVEGAGRIAITWSPSGLDWGSLVSGLLGP